MNVDQAIVAAGKRGFKPVELPVRLRRAHHQRCAQSMIPTMWSPWFAEPIPTPGSNVIFTAHYDHLGIDPNLAWRQDLQRSGGQCDRLRHSAGDRAAFAQSAAPPPRNVYFASVTAEEQGLLGSKYLGMHPPVPDKDLSLDLNFDELLAHRHALSRRTSAGRSAPAFYPVVEKTAAAFDLKIRAGRRSDGGRYYRSDHFSFARVGSAGILRRGGQPVRGAYGRLGQAAGRGLPRPVIIGRPMNIARIWISAAMPKWPGLGSY